MATLNKNMEIQMEITAITHEGEGIGRHDGMAVFVPQSAIGDKLLVRIVKVMKHHAYGIPLEILTPAPTRIENNCPAFRHCGGCTFRHFDYSEELRVKESLVRENLQRLAGVELPPELIMPSPEHARYRNKAQYPVRLVEGRVRTGFFARRSHRLIPVEDCLLQPEFFAEFCRILCGFMEEFDIPPYNEKAHTGLVRHLYLRHAGATGELMVSLIVNGKKLPHWATLLERFQTVHPVTTLILDSNTARTNVITGKKQSVLHGGGTITDRLAGVDLTLSPNSFYQVNRPAAEALYRQAADYLELTGGETLLDLYCGAGSIGLSMAGKVESLIGVEVVEAAVQNAGENARKNGITNARFIQGDAGQAAAELAAEGLHPDAVVLDPPRRGADEATLQAICDMAPKRICYISCNSATLARDCAWLREHGYGVTRYRPADLFPRTPHVECVTLLTPR